MPDGVYWWALGCLPLSVLLHSRLLAIQMMVLALLWFYLEVDLEVDLGCYPVTLPLFVAAAAYVAFRSEGSDILFLTIPVTVGTLDIVRPKPALGARCAWPLGSRTPYRYGKLSCRRVRV